MPPSAAISAVGMEARWSMRSTVVVIALCLCGVGCGMEGRSIRCYCETRAKGSAVPSGSKGFDPICIEVGGGREAERGKIEARLKKECEDGAWAGGVERTCRCPCFDFDPCEL